MTLHIVFGKIVEYKILSVSELVLESNETAQKYSGPWNELTSGTEVIPANEMVAFFFFVFKLKFDEKNKKNFSLLNILFKFYLNAKRSGLGLV